LAGVEGSDCLLDVAAQLFGKLDRNRVTNLEMHITFVTADELPRVWESLETSIFSVRERTEAVSLDAPQGDISIWIPHELCSFTSIPWFATGTDVPLSKTPYRRGVYCGEGAVPIPNRVAIGSCAGKPYNAYWGLYAGILSSVNMHLRLESPRGIMVRQRNLVVMSEIP